MIVYNTLDELRRLIEGFANRTLPCHEWTHQAHLIVGLWYCLQHDATTATDILRNSIKQYNLACGKQNTDTSGYHETITRFYVWYIKRYLDGADPQCSFLNIVNDFCTHHVESSSPLRFYSQERLMSVEARLGWLNPDLQPLLWSHSQQDFC